MKQIVVNKGYTLKVVSWENDGDNYSTIFKTVDTIEEAIKLAKICKELFESGSNTKKCVGNSMDGEGDKILLDYVEVNRNLFPDLNDEDDIIEYFKDIADSLMSSSEFYDFRVCDSVSITYSTEDIMVENIDLSKYGL